jgi:hypothetical protein
MTTKKRVLVHGPKSDYTLAVGDKVKLRYDWCGDTSVVRKIEFVEASTRHGSGACASADGGKLCKECGRTPDRTFRHLDASHFVPVRGKK